LKGDLKNNAKSNITLSIDNQLVRQLRNEAESQGLSINAKVSSILSKYVMFYKDTEQEKYVTMPQKMYATLLDEINEEKLRRLINMRSLEMMLSIFVRNNIQFTMDNLIKRCFQGFSLWSGIYNNFQYYRDANNDLCLVFEHSFGEKWSKILGENVTNLIGEMLNLPAEYQAIMNTLLVKVKDK